MTPDRLEKEMELFTWKLSMSGVKCRREQFWWDCLWSWEGRYPSLIRCIADELRDATAPPHVQEYMHTVDGLLTFEAALRVRLRKHAESLLEQLTPCRVHRSAEAPSTSGNYVSPHRFRGWDKDSPTLPGCIGVLTGVVARTAQL